MNFKENPIVVIVINKISGEKPLKQSGTYRKISM